MYRQRTDTALRTFALALTAVLAVLRLSGAVHFLTSSIAAIRYPFELDFGEGVVLNQTRLLMSWHSLYQPIDHWPFIVSVYPPLYPMVTAVADVLVGNTLAVGRTVSLTSAILAAVIIGVLAWRAIGSQATALVRGLPALIAGLGFLNVSYTASWAPLMRIDMLAHLLTLCGLLLFVVLAPRSNRACWSALPFLLALYTRQSAVAAPAACLIVALCVRPALAARFAALLIGLGLSSFALINVATDGQFYLHVVGAQRTVYDWHRMLWYVSDLRLRYPVEIAVTLVTIRSLLRGLWLRPVAGRPPASGATDLNWARPVLGVYAFTAFLVTLTVGRVGSEVNYLIELMGVVCACAAVALGDALAAATPRPGAREGGLASLSAVLLSALLLVPASGLLRPPAVEWVEIPSAEYQHEMERLVELIRHVDGPVLSQSATPTVLAGKPVEYQSCDALGQLARLGRWDPKLFIARIERRDYHAIILGFDASKPQESTSFTPAMLEAVQRHYALAEVIANFRIYRPRERGA